MIEEKWHAMTEDAVCRELSTSRNGLTDEDAEQRLVQYGINALPVKKPPTPVENFAASNTQSGDLHPDCGAGATVHMAVFMPEPQLIEMELGGRG